MPIIVPIIAGGIVAATSLTGVVQSIRGGLKLRQNKKQYDERLQQYQSKEAEAQAYVDTLQNHFVLLGETRLESIVALRYVAEYLRKAKIKDRDLTSEAMEFVNEQLTQWETKYFEPLKIGYGVALSAVTGAGTAYLANTAALSIGVASTGTAIASLSGVAATNAALAWLGGGALAAGGGGMALGTLILGGITIGPALMVGGLMVNKKAIDARTQMEAAFAAMDIAEAEMIRKQAEFVVVEARIDELQIALQTSANAACQMADTLADNYPAEDAPIEDVFKLARTAKNLATLIDVRLLDDDGQLLSEKA